MKTISYISIVRLIQSQLIEIEQEQKLHQKETVASRTKYSHNFTTNLLYLYHLYLTQQPLFISLLL